MSVPSPSPSTPGPQMARTAATPIVASARKPTTSRSIGFTPAPTASNSGAAEDVNGGGSSWRGESSPRSALVNGPEKTVGGFEKKDLVPASPNGNGTGDKDKDGKANLSHVPCRFFKQGACTAGANCPFSHSLPEPGKKEVCQWFLKGNCKFGHKCALAHVRPGEPMSMDRKNKKDQQREQREKEAGGGGGTPTGADSGKNRLSLPLGSSLDNSGEGSFASPVPIRSALSSSIQSPPTSSASQRHSSSPMREPFGPPSAGLGGSPAGFGRSPIAAFSSSPSRPSPLSASFSGRPSVPGPLALKNGTGAVTNHSPLRPPTSAQSAGFSSSFSHAIVPTDHRAAAPPLSASLADGGSHIKNIWARSDSAAEPLSPRRPILQHPRQSNEMVFLDDDNDDDHGEDFLPASLNDLLTPAERARRLSRRDSNDSHGVSPARGGFLSAKWTTTPGAGPERLAQSAGANLGPANFLQSLWSNDGADKRRGDESPYSAGLPRPTAGPSPATATAAGGAGGGAWAAGAPRQSLLSQQRTPATATGTSPGRSVESNNFLLRHPPHPSSPSARAFQEHAPGQSLPGGVATALSRLHLHAPGPSGLAPSPMPADSDKREPTPPMSTVPLPTKRADDHDEGLFAMDG